MYTIDKWKLDVQLLVYSVTQLLEIIQPIRSSILHNDDLHISNSFESIKLKSANISDMVELSISEIKKTLHNIYTLDTIAHLAKNILCILERDDFKNIMKVNLNIRDKKDSSTAITDIYNKLKSINTGTIELFNSFITRMSKTELETIPESIFAKFHKNNSTLVAKFLILILNKIKNIKYIEKYKDAIFKTERNDKNTYILISMGITFNLFPVYNNVDIKTYDASKLLTLNATIPNNNVMTEYRLLDMLQGEATTIPKTFGINQRLIRVMDTIKQVPINIGKNIKKGADVYNTSFMCLETTDNGSTYRLLKTKDSSVLPSHYFNMLKGPPYRITGYNEEILKQINIDKNKIVYPNKRSDLADVSGIISKMYNTSDAEKIHILKMHFFKNSELTIYQYIKLYSMLPSIYKIMKGGKTVPNVIINQFNYADTL